MEKITLDSEHNYKLHRGATQKPLISVTQLLAKYFRASEFLDYVDPERAEELAQRGTEIHKRLADADRARRQKAEYWNENEPAETMEQKWRKFVWNTASVHMIDFRQKLKMEVEAAIYSEELRMAGTPDRIVYPAAFAATIIEIKTGVPAPAHELQTGAYRLLLEKNLARMQVTEVIAYVNERGDVRPAIPKRPWNERKAALSAALDIEAYASNYIKPIPDLQTVNL